MLLFLLVPLKSLSYEIHNRVPRTSYKFEFATLVKTQTQIVTHTRDEISDCRIETRHALAIPVLDERSLQNYILLNEPTCWSYSHKGGQEILNSAHCGNRTTVARACK